MEEIRESKKERSRRNR